MWISKAKGCRPTGKKCGCGPESFAGNSSHVRQSYRSQSKIGKARRASVLVVELSKAALEHGRNRVMGTLRNVEETLTQRVANGMNMELQPKSKAVVGPRDMKLSRAPRIIGQCGRAG